MKTLIIDDEQDACINLKVFIEKFCPLITIVGIAQDVDEGLQLIKTECPDLIFLDIQMPGGTGFHLLESVEHRNFQVIFVTSYHEYAIKAIKTAALDYILKPIDIAELKIAVQRAISMHTLKIKEQLLESKPENLPQQIAVKTKNGMQLINLNNLVYCEAETRYVHLYILDKKKVLVCQNLKQIEEVLENKGFIRVHHRYLMNIMHIKEYRSKSLLGNGGSLVTLDGMEIPVSARKKKLVIEHFQKFAITQSYN